MGKDIPDNIDWDNIDLDNPDDLKKIGVEKDIDKVEGFTKLGVDELLGLSIEEIEIKKDVNIIIGNEKVEIFTKSGDLIGYIEKGHYSHNGVDDANHLRHLVFEEYTGKGYGELLFNLYKKNFRIPPIEYSHTDSMIGFLQKVGYVIDDTFNNGTNTKRFIYVG